MSEDSLHLDLEPRKVTGKAVKHLRKEGFVPAVIHDHGKTSVNVQVAYQPLRQLYLKAGKHHPISIKAGSHSYTALIKSVSFEPKKNMMTHVVFNAVKKNQKVEAEIPVRPRYAEGNDSSPAERAGLIVLDQLDAVEVRAVADKLPDVIEYNAEDLVNDGDQLTVADLIIPEGVEVVTESNHPVAVVTTTAALQAANDEAGGAPEEEEASEVPAVHEGASDMDETGQADEIRPGGHEQKPDHAQATGEKEQ